VSELWSNYAGSWVRILGAADSRSGLNLLTGLMRLIDLSGAGTCPEEAGRQRGINAASQNGEGPETSNSLAATASAKQRERAASGPCL